MFTLINTLSFNIHISSHYDKIPDQSHLWKEGLALTDSSKMQSIMMEKECSQHKVADGFAYTVRIQR